MHLMKTGFVILRQCEVEQFVSTAKFSVSCVVMTVTNINDLLNGFIYPISLTSIGVYSGLRSPQNSNVRRIQSCVYTVPYKSLRIFMTWRLAILKNSSSKSRIKFFSGNWMYLAPFKLTSLLNDFIEPTFLCIWNASESFLKRVSFLFGGTSDKFSLFRMKLYPNFISKCALIPNICIKLFLPL